MTGIQLNKLSELSQFVINDILDHVCCCSEVFLLASASLHMHRAAQTLECELSVFWEEFCLSKGRKCKFPGLTFTLSKTMDFVNAATQPKLPLPRHIKLLTKTHRQISALHVQTCPYCPKL